jgi:hypothetical protein
MQREVLRVKRAHLLSQNQIREIIMDSDSDEKEYYTSENMEDKEEPRPPSQWSSISQPASPHYSARSSEDEDDGFKQYIPIKHKRFSIKMFKLAAITIKAYVACVQRGREANGDIQVCQV